jgi:ribonuclease HI
MYDRLPAPEITIHFDGSTKEGNPGLGGASAVILIDDEAVTSVWNRMGVVGSNCAEYYGLILGLREIVHLYPYIPFNLTIKGDSELVIKQLKGECQVNNGVVKNYYLVADGLLKDIQRSRDPCTIRLLHIPREENRQADALAKRAAGVRIKPNLRYFHYPALEKFLDGEIQGQNHSAKIKVAHDGAVCFTPEIYVDATLLRTVNGDEALQTIKSTGKKILIEGKADMTVLGLATIKFTFGRGLITVDDALVVDYLPWPLQISFFHPAISYDLIPSCDTGFKSNWRAEVSPFHQGHPYWTSNALMSAFASS